MNPNDGNYSRGTHYENIDLSRNLFTTKIISSIENITEKSQGNIRTR